MLNKYDVDMNYGTSFTYRFCFKGSELLISWKNVYNN